MDYICYKKEKWLFISGFIFINFTEIFDMNYGTQKIPITLFCYTYFLIGPISTPLGPVGDKNYFNQINKSISYFKSMDWNILK